MSRTIFGASAIGLAGIGLLSIVLSSTASAQLPSGDARARASFESDFLARWPAQIVCMSFKNWDLPKNATSIEQQNALFRLLNAYIQIDKIDQKTVVGGMVVYESRVAGQDRTIVVNAVTKRVMSIGGSLPQPNSCYVGMHVDPAIRAEEDTYRRP